MSPRDLWARYRKLCCVCDSIGVTLDVSRMKFPTPFSSAWPSTLRRFAEYPPRRRGNRAIKRRSGCGSCEATWGMRIERRHAIL